VTISCQINGYQLQLVSDCNQIAVRSPFEDKDQLRTRCVTPNRTAMATQLDFTPENAWPGVFGCTSATPSAVHSLMAHPLWHHFASGEASSALSSHALQEFALEGTLFDSAGVALVTDMGRICYQDHWKYGRQIFAGSGGAETLLSACHQARSELYLESGVCCNISEVICISEPFWYIRKDSGHFWLQVVQVRDRDLQIDARAGTLGLAGEPLWSREMLYHKHVDCSNLAYAPQPPIAARKLGYDWFTGTPYANAEDARPGFGVSPLRSLREQATQWRSVDFDTLVAAETCGILSAPSRTEKVEVRSAAEINLAQNLVAEEYGRLWLQIMGGLATESWGLCTSKAWQDMHSYSDRLSQLLCHSLHV
jgi:hypothetical protein